jgi:hypothetical protein
MKLVTYSVGGGETRVGSVEDGRYSLSAVPA